MTPKPSKTILFWGRADPNYSRTRVVREAFKGLGWSERFFVPRVSKLARLEASIRRMPKPDVVWVPCFRQRDVLSACRWAKRRSIPVIFDALISAFDKQVYERRKFAADSAQGRKLLAWEQGMLSLPDVIVVDTDAHATYFHEMLNMPRERLVVVPVGAEAKLFEHATLPSENISRPREVLFYGSFIGLQGPEIIVEAARLCPDAQWVLLGDGPLREACKHAAQNLSNVVFEEPIPYEQLPERIHRADILLGIFGSSDKAGRVIPNKVYQSLACGRTVITRKSPAYPPALRELSLQDSGMVFVPRGDAAALADAVRTLCQERESLDALGIAARKSYERWFSPQAIQDALKQVLGKCVG